MHELVRRHLPGLAEPPHLSKVCLYTNTPDEHFILDRHPRHPNVRIVSPCSGHGFKFASAIGELVADELEGKRPAFDLSLFSLARFCCPEQRFSPR
jgi:glycine/D-amino acid oxidase-like deaminating enzyme